MTALSFSSARLEINRRSRQVYATLAKDGYGTLLDRTRQKISDWIRPQRYDWPVFPEDVVKADLMRGPSAPVRRIEENEPIAINWVTGPASAGSGGHTTIARMIEYLQAKGHINRLYLYDPYSADQKYYEDILRKHFGITCEIGNVRTGMVDAHAVIATNWPSAYAVFNARSAGRRFYFVQDYEPYFYPTGTASVLAENTYRMGFHGITAGPWLAEKLSHEFGMETSSFPFGCDVAHYRRLPNARRSGVAFYARQSTPRRAVELGFLALEIFANRNPNIDLHLFGQDIAGLPFRFINHGTVTPAKLNEIYNQCIAGLSLSLTNTSLVPHEMLAAGCIPVVNDDQKNHAVLNNPHIRYASLAPHALAAEIEAIVTMPGREAASIQAAESVAFTSWSAAGAAVEAALYAALR